MLPPTPIRRLILVPLVVVIAGALAALTPAVALLTVAFNLIRRRTGLGREPRSRLLRVVWLGLAWSAGEIAALTVFLCLWLVSRSSCCAATLARATRCCSFTTC